MKIFNKLGKIIASLLFLTSCSNGLELEKFHMKKAISNDVNLKIEGESEMNEGSTSYFNVFLTNTTLSCLKVSIYYDHEYLMVPQWYEMYSFIDINESNGDFFVSNVEEPGLFQFTYLFREDRSFDNTYITGFYLESKSGSLNTNVETYIDVLVEECFDSSLNDVELNSKSFKLTLINELDIDNIYEPDIYIYTNQYPFYLDEETTIDIYFTGITPFSCGEMRFNYDSEHFEFVGYQYRNLENVSLKDINISREGEILISFINAQQIIDSGYLISFVLRPIKVSYGSLYLELNNFSNANLDKFQNVIRSCAYDVIKNPSFVPGVGLTYVETLNLKSFNTTFYITKETNLGAGDFTINFDPVLLKLETYSLLNSKEYSLGVNVKKANEGIITVSLLSMKGLIEAFDLVDFTFSSLEKRLCDSSITISSQNTVNPQFSPISLNTTNLEVLHQHYSSYVTTYPSTCLNHGLATYVCDYCGTYVEEVLELSNEHLSVGIQIDEENNQVTEYCYECNTVINVRNAELIDYIERWINDYLFFNDISLEDLGQGFCAGPDGYYQSAKKELLRLEDKFPGIMLEFYNSKHIHAIERFCAWARANGEVFDPVNGKINKMNYIKFDSLLSSKEINIFTPVFICGLLIIGAMILYLFLRRKFKK